MRTIIFGIEAAKEFDAIDPVQRSRIERALDVLAIDPPSLAGQIKRLKGRQSLRLRVGDWRIIFDVTERTIIVLAVGHRRDIYR